MDIFIPKKLKDFIINKEIALQLNNFNKKNILNTLIYGSRNSGKKTLIKALLNSIYDIDIDKISQINTFDLKIGNNKVSITYTSSPYHFEINLYEYGLYDKNIITEFILDLIKFKNIKLGCFKIIILNHFECVSSNAQMLLKRMFEKHTNARFFLISEQISKVDNCLLSRCFCVRIQTPNKIELTNYIDQIANKYSINDNIIKKIDKNYNLFLINNILINSIHNLNFDFEEVLKLDQSINKIINLINKKNINSILEIRTICYNLLLLNLGVDFVFKKIVNHYLNSNLNDSKKILILNAASDTNKILKNVEHNLISLEYFILKVKKILYKVLNK